MLNAALNMVPNSATALQGGAPPWAVLPGRLLGWLLALFLLMPSLPAGAPPLVSPKSAASQPPTVSDRTQASETSSAALAPDLTPPKPAPVDPKTLAPVFSKPSPTSIADLKAIEQQVKAVVKRVSPAVVAVEVGFASGSGVVISADGLVLTAGHVCGWPQRAVRFTFPDGRSARGQTLGLEEESDTGLMRIFDRGPWPHVPLGDLDQARLGDWVLALGHPGGFDLRRSLVVRLGRIIRLTPEALQTDCTISPGDSGGPLFDMFGRVIGIHSSISDSLSENFHVPITDFYDTWSVLANGHPATQPVLLQRAYLGATAVDRVAGAGCRLSAVDEHGPAAKAGLKPGDLVVKVEGREIKVAASLDRWVAESEPGDTLKVEVARGDQSLSFEVTLESPPAHP